MASIPTPAADDNGKIVIEKADLDKLIVFAEDKIPDWLKSWAKVLVPILLPILLAAGATIGIVIKENVTPTPVINGTPAADISGKLLAGLDSNTGAIKDLTVEVHQWAKPRPIPVPPIPVPGAPVTINAPADGVIPGVGMTKITATAATDFVWLYPPGELTPLFDLHAAGKTLLVTPKGSGEVIIGAAAVVDGKILATWVKLRSGDAPTPPGPTPPGPVPPNPTPPTPSPVAKNLYFIAFYDKAAKDNPKIIDDLEYWQGLIKEGHDWRKADVNSPDWQSWKAFLDKDGIPAPALVILDDTIAPRRKLAIVPMPRDRSAFEALKLKYTGTK